MKKRIALFEADWGFTIIEKEDEKYTEAVRISEYTDIELKMLPKEEIIAKKVEALDKEMEQIKSEALDKCSKIQIKKQELMALTVSKDDEDEE